MQHRALWKRAALVVVAVLAFTSAALAEPVTLTFLTWGNNPQEIAGNEAIIGRFEQLNPDIKVEVLFATFDEFADRAITLAIAGELPDLLWVGTNLPDFASRGLLLDITDLIAKDPDFHAERYFPGALSLGEFRGRQYTLPRDLSTFTVFYNRNMLLEAGLAAPPFDWTYDDLAEYARKLTRPQDQKFAFGLIDRNRWGIIDAFGGTIASDDWSQLIFDEKAVDAIQWIADWALVNHFDVLPSDGIGGYFYTHFVDEHVAMIWDGPWSFGHYDEVLDFEWDIAVPPAGPVKAGSNMMGLTIGISSQTKHVDAAYKLLKFLTQDPVAQELQVSLGVASPSIGVPSVIEALFDSPTAPPTIAAYAEAMNHLTPTPEGKALGMTEALGTIQNAINQILAGEAPARQALPEAVRVANVALERAAAR